MLVYAVTYHYYEDYWIECVFSTREAAEAYVASPEQRPFCLEIELLMANVAKAMVFAELAHKGQVRKYTGVPYFTHCKEVANIVAEYGGSEAMIAAAYLHDTVEDCKVTFGEIEDWFGREVEFLVGWLTDVSVPTDGNRATRKEIDRIHTANASAAAQFVKCADIISNTQDIVDNDPKGFAIVYLKEMVKLLQVLTKVEGAIYEKAKATVFLGCFLCGVEYDI